MTSFPTACFKSVEVIHLYTWIADGFNGKTLGSGSKTLTEEDRFARLNYASLMNMNKSSGTIS